MNAGGVERIGDPVEGDAVRFLMRECRPQRRLAGAPFRVARAPDGGASIEFRRAGERYLLRFPGLADFSISADGCEVACAPAPRATAENIEHLWLHQAWPLARSIQGAAVFHGSCVEIRGAAVAFLGESGRGKSTLAAKFACSGCRFLCDDGLIVRCVGRVNFVAPSHPSLRLRADSRAALALQDGERTMSQTRDSKSFLRAGETLAFCDCARELAAVYFIGENDVADVVFKRLTAREAMLLFMRNSFLLDVEDRALTSRHFARAATLSNQTPCFELEFARRFDQLDHLMEAIIANFVSLGSAT